MILRETQWRALFELAKLELKNKRNREAKALLIQAIDIIETMRADIKIEQLRDGFVINKMEVYETLVTVLVNMGDSTGAFDVAERSRARNFIDLLGNHHILFGNKLYDQSKAIKAKIEEYETLAAQAADDAEKKVYQETLDRANDEYKDLLLKIQLDNPQLASLVSVNPLNERQIRALLEPNVTLLSYYVTADEILTWVVRADKIELVRTPLGRKTLEQSIKNYRRMLQNLEPLEAQSKELYDWVIAPIKPKLSGAQYVGIIPHGLLHYLSFATLSDGNDFFIEQYPLFYLPSGSVFQYTLQRRTPQKQLKVLAVGNPELNNPALALPFAEQEVETIQWNFPEITVLTREKATESWIVKNIQDFGIIHIASHGEFDPINPLFSSLKLKQDLNYDGNLEAVEIFDLKIKADLVMLSACQTGLGKITDGDEVIGLNRSFIYAGTHAIISSLWRVSDISTALLVKYFYRQYARSNKINALRSAMLDVKATYPHPGYWGAFALVGDYQ
jgi:CHAT domain-containing protein